MAKLGQLLGLDPATVMRMSDYDAQNLALHVSDALFKTALANPKSLSPAMRDVVKARVGRVTRAMRQTEARLDESSGLGGLGAPPDVED